MSVPQSPGCGAALHQPMMFVSDDHNIPQRGHTNSMATSAPRPCTHPGCGVLVHDGSGRCTKHPKTAWVKKGTATKRITGRRLQAMRTELFTRSPLCAECQRVGRVTRAVERDHIVPLYEGGTDTPDNTQGLCLDCHNAKSIAESTRARLRSIPHP
jgi:5-methylcytosine-specific restriction enzyme A